MIDILGNEFTTGDRVLFSRPKTYYHPHSIARGEVTRITKTRISILLDEEFRQDYANRVVVSTQDAHHFIREDAAVR